MINIDTITIEGFRGFINPVVYKYDSPGINIIQGKNGGGKSTICTDALSWALWKKLVKPNKTSFLPWPHVIDDSYRGVMVKVLWKKGDDIYCVIRCHEYQGKINGQLGKNRLITSCNGEEVYKDIRDKADQQRWINKNLGYSFELFKSTVLFAQELDRFMQEDGPTKKQIFDEAFESTFILNAKERVETTLKSQVIEKDKLVHTLDKTKLSYTSTKSQLTQATVIQNNFETAKQNKIQRLRLKLGLAKTELSEIGIDAKDLKSAEKEKENLIKIQTKIESKKEKLRDLENEEFQSNMGLNAKNDKLERLQQDYTIIKSKIASSGNYKKCPECGGVINKDKSKELKDRLLEEGKKMNSQIKALTPECELLATQYEDCLVRLNKVRGSIAKLPKDVSQKLAQVENRINQFLEHKKSKKRLEKEITEIEQDIVREERAELPDLKIPSLTKLCQELKQNKITTLAELKSLKRKIKINEWLVKEPLSNSGLKAFIFDSMLAKLNQYLLAYTPLVGFRIKVYVDMNLATKPITASVTKNGDEVPYEDLSKGQKQLANVAIAFSLNDIVNESKPINILILDELFENLDEENLEAVGNIIIQKSKKTSIHLITHQTKFSPPNAKYTYVYQNQKGQSLLE